MTGRTLYWLGDGADEVRFTRIGADGLLAAEGAWHSDGDPPHDPEDFVVVAVPGQSAPVHGQALDGTAAQARTAARLALADTLAAGSGAAHVAVSETAEEGGNRLVALVDRDVMTDWLGACARLRITPTVMVPEPVLLTAPIDGFVSGPGTFGDILARGPDEAFAADPALAKAVIGGAAVRHLSAADIRQMQLAESETPALNLLQGDFAAAQPAAGQGTTRRTALLVGLALVALWLSALFDAWRHDRSAHALEAVIAETVAAAGVNAQTPGAALPALRLAAAERGAGGAFMLAFEALTAGIRGSAGLTIVSLDWQGGRLMAELAVAPGADPEALRAGVEAAGLRFVAGPVSGGEGTGNRAAVEITP
ncbi:MAG: type II secretion system protein GspL [Pacificimonas sp.]|jgi:type II secretion system protein L|nr:type II secretion system protein GspL [Pacificimonas sp.]